MLLSIHHAIALLFGFLAVITAIILIARQSETAKLNRFLAGILVLVGLISITETAIYSLYTTKTYHFLKYYLPIDLFLASAIPPLLYGYIKTLLNYKFTWRSFFLAAAQTLPALAIFIQMCVFSDDERIRTSIWRIENSHLEFNVFFSFLIIQSLFYCLRCAKKTDKKNTQSDTFVYNGTHIDMRILRTTFWIILSFFTVGSTVFVLSSEPEVKLLAGTAFMYGGLFFLAYHTIWTKQFIYGKITTFDYPQINIPQKTQNDWGITPEELQIAFISTGIHHNSDCNLKTAAEAIGLPPYQLNAYLNAHLNTTFSQYIHGIRIEEAKQLLTQNPNIDMEELSKKCGFGSKSSFYNAFKRHTGVTPMAFANSKYVKQC